ncbi:MULTISPECIES: hypothetical protein [Streptomyces]|uniref:Lipoprotein n=1 Tax=Streptomyces ramulosus TaxID=47762 RepID=A0ABW1FPS6_9ACTN
MYQSTAELIGVVTFGIVTACGAIKKFQPPPEVRAARRRQRTIERLDCERRRRLRTTLRALTPGTVVQDKGPDDSEMTVIRQFPTAPQRGVYRLW